MKHEQEKTWLLLRLSQFVVDRRKEDLVANGGRFEGCKNGCEHEGKNGSASDRMGAGGVRASDRRDGAGGL